MAAEVLSLVSQLETAIQKVPKSEWDTQDAAIRRQASDTLRKLSLDLEDWGDLVDRVIYSVSTSTFSLLLHARLTHVPAHGQCHDSIGA